MVLANCALDAVYEDCQCDMVNPPLRMRVSNDSGNTAWCCGRKVKEVGRYFLYDVGAGYLCACCDDPGLGNLCAMKHHIYPDINPPYERKWK